jgi:O-antigen/teichoic acid export membrane protein
MMSVLPVPGWRASLAARVAGLRASRFGRDTAIVAGASGLERIAALAQTVLVARALGIAEYGAYGLLFTSIGFVASIMGLQMGLAATVLVARHRETAPERAAAVIGHAMRFAWLVGAAFVLASLPFATELSDWLLQSPRHAIAVALGCVFVAASLVSGTQDGVVQGFEDFAASARVRLATVLLTLVAIYPAARAFGLAGVLVATLAGLLLRYLLLARIIAAHRRAAALPPRGSGVGFRELVLGFSLPSMLASLLVGGLLWLGSLLLSRQPLGFESVAMVNTGLQWRGPILLLAAAVGSVALPVFSRHAGANDHAAGRALRSRLLRANAVGASLGALALSLAAVPLLSLYGTGFAAGAWVFVLLVASTVPAVVANVYMQELVGSGRLWRQLWIHLPMAVTMAGGFVLLVPRQQGLGYAITVLAGALVLLASGAIAARSSRMEG